MKKVTLLLLVLCFASYSQAGIHKFPSSSSTVVGSVGIIDADQIGYFWSVARGDKVTETFTDPLASITTADFDFYVPFNILSSGVQVDWDVQINSVTIGSFTINDSFTGPVDLDLNFAPISAIAGTYDIGFIVTNEVPSGDGSHTFAYSDLYVHSVELGNSVIPAPAAILLTGMGSGLVGWFRRRRTL